MQLQVPMPQLTELLTVLYLQGLLIYVSNNCPRKLGIHAKRSEKAYASVPFYHSHPLPLGSSVPQHGKGLGAQN